MWQELAQGVADPLSGRMPRRQQSDADEIHEHGHSGRKPPLICLPSRGRHQLGAPRVIKFDAWQGGVIRRNMKTQSSETGGPPGNSPANNSGLAHAVSALTGACCTAWTWTSWWDRICNLGLTAYIL